MKEGGIHNFSKAISQITFPASVVSSRIDDVSKAFIYYESAIFHQQSGGYMGCLGLIWPFEKNDPTGIINRNIILTVTL